MSDMETYVDKMNAYIRNTRMGDTDGFRLTTKELLAAYRMIEKGEVFEALGLMFNYGRAKGCRMARRAQG